MRLVRLPPISVLTRSRIEAARSGLLSRLLLDDALDHRLRKGNAAGLDCLQVDGRKEIRARLIRSSGTIGGDVRQRANRLATCCTDEGGGILPLEQSAQRRRLPRRDVEQHALA